MKKLIFTFIILLFAHPAGAGRTFTDSDLEIYKKDNSVAIKDQYRPVHRKETALKQPDNTAQKEKQSWCRRGKKHRDTVNRAQADLDKAEHRIDEYRKALAVRKSDLRSAMRNLKRSREKLDAAEEEYRNFEDRAYRQNIPRDWYECYYDGYDEYRGY
ncbi:MAG: hypothetical protein AMK71_11315 [Nitrospira bacterium SG8_35_4]|nr:MAG: hypothetical protein AMK71_11315 [Nitrospira bacterium SG8_35_4]